MDDVIFQRIKILKDRLEQSSDELPLVQQEAEQLASSFLQSPEILAELGGIFDSNGYEREACVWYERAFEFDLDSFPAHLAPHFCVWYGSTLRNIGRLVDSEKILRMALNKWPRFSALQFFLALTFMSQGRKMGAIAALAELHAGAWDESLKEYSRAVESYLAEELRPAASCADS